MIPKIVGSFLSKLPFNGNKTVLGVFSLIVYAAMVFFPQYQSLILEILSYMGLVLTPVGLVHKSIKNNSGSSY